MDILGTYDAGVNSMESIYLIFRVEVVVQAHILDLGVIFEETVSLAV